MPDDPMLIRRMLDRERLFLWKQTDQESHPDAPEDERMEIVLERSMSIPRYAKVVELEQRFRKLESAQEREAAAAENPKKQRAIAANHSSEKQALINELLHLHISIIQDVFYEKQYYSEIFDDEPYHFSI